jgi:hypothetical protein
VSDEEPVDALGQHDDTDLPGSTAEVLEDVGELCQRSKGQPFLGWTGEGADGEVIFDLGRPLAAIGHGPPPCSCGLLPLRY